MRLTIAPILYTVLIGCVITGCASEPAATEPQPTPLVEKSTSLFIPPPQKPRPAPPQEEPQLQETNPQTSPKQQNPLDIAATPDAEPPDQAPEPTTPAKSTADHTDTAASSKDQPETAAAPKAPEPKGEDAPPSPDAATAPPEPAGDLNKPFVIGGAGKKPAKPTPPPMKKESEEEIAGVVPQAPDEITLEKAAPKKLKDEALREALTLLRGQWRQTDNSNQPDAFEGGYRLSVMTFRDDGVVEIERRFDKAGDVVLRRKADYSIEQGAIVIGEKVRPGKGVILKKEVAIPTADGGSVTIRPAVNAFPWNAKFKVKGNVLSIGGKTYSRVVEEK